MWARSSRAVFEAKREFRSETNRDVPVVDDGQVDVAAETFSGAEDAGAARCAGMS
jgi:hypothetical protein